MTDRTLIYPGSDVKAVGAGKVAGYLVRFGSPESADSQNDFFTSQTYFGRAIKSGIDVVWHHGIGRTGHGATLGNRVIGGANLTMRPDGLWAEGELDTSVKAVADVYADVEAGKVGWSSGSVDRLVQREPVGHARAIKSWPIIEASLSHIPVDPRNKAVAIKALDDELPGESATETLVAFAERLAADCKACCGLFAKALSQRQAAGRNLSPEKREAIKALVDELDALYRVTSPRPAPEHLAALKRRLLASRI